MKLSIQAVADKVIKNLNLGTSMINKVKLTPEQKDELISFFSE